MEQRVNYKGQIVKGMRLQGIGWMPSVPASMVQVDDELLWNYSGRRYMVSNVEQTSPKFLTVTEREVESGKTYTRKLKVDRHVVIRRNGELLTA